MSEIKSTVTTNDLPPCEQEAADFVRRIGLERAYRILDKLTQRFDRRYARACAECFAPINREWIRSTPLELDLSHRIKIGISIVDDYFTPYAAHQRIIARRLAQKEARKLRAASKKSNA